MSGRPLRFLVATAIGWTALRVFMLWPADSTKPIRAFVIPPAPAADEPPPARTPVGYIASVTASRRIAPWFALPSPSSVALAKPRLAPDPDRIALAILGLLSPGALRYLDEGAPQLASPLPGAPTVPPAGASRWSASAWLLLRDGRRGPPGLGGGQLGGSQGGFRIVYALGDARRVALYTRVVSPVSGAGREMTLGVEWRPTRLPVRVVAERRFSLDGSKGGPAIGLVGGTGPDRLAGGFDLETYGQAGVIRRDRTEAFADGAARLTRRIGKLDLGVGTWGGAQRDAQRLDIGPTIGVRVAVGGKVVRVSADWRQRVAGHARPASGPALTLGSDF